MGITTGWEPYPSGSHARSLQCKQNIHTLEGRKVLFRARRGNSHSRSQHCHLAVPAQARDASSAEMRVAVLRVVDSKYGARRDETVTIVSRLLGFKATSSQLRAIINCEIDKLVSGGLLVTRDDGTLVCPGG